MNDSSKQMLKLIIAEAILKEFEADSEDSEGSEGNPRIVRRISAARRLKATRVRKGLDTGREGLHYKGTDSINSIRQPEPKKVVKTRNRNLKGPLGHSIANSLERRSKGGSSNMTKRLGGKWEGNRTKPMPLNPKGLPGRGKDTSSVRGKTINTSAGNSDEIDRKTNASDSAFGGLVSKLSTTKGPSRAELKQQMVQRQIRRKALVRRAMQLRK